MRFFIVLLVSCLFLSANAQATIWQVTVSDFEFSPAFLTILQGDTVRWTNDGGFHNVRHICEPNLFGNDPADAPWTYQFIFMVNPGNYPYQCDIHPDMMQGTVTVERRGLWNVTVRSFSFTPQHLTVLPGDTVRWTNVSGFHNVHNTGTPSLFGNTLASAPWSYSFVFNLPDGTYNYVCEQHSSVMTGSVTVASPAPLDTPLALVAFQDAGLVHLNWQPVCGVSAYRVYRSADAAFNPFPSMVGETTETTYSEPVDTAATARYFYEVRAAVP